MKIRVCFFASIRELVGESQIDLELEKSAGVENLPEALERHLGQKCWGLLEKRLFKIAVNQSLSTPGQMLKEGDEVALLPQVTGG